MASVAEIFETLEYGPAPESAGPVKEWLARHGATFGQYINGKWTKPAAELFDVMNPANRTLLARVALFGCPRKRRRIRAPRTRDQRDGTRARIRLGTLHAGADPEGPAR